MSKGIYLCAHKPGHEVCLEMNRQTYRERFAADLRRALAVKLLPARCAT